MGITAEAISGGEITKRAVVPALEDILLKPFSVLDHGFIRVVDYMGDDSSIVQAARATLGRGAKTPAEDRTFLRYMMRHGHTSPFEMCEIKLHVKMPIFVARQWVRHRTATINEYSARYSVMDKEFFLPEHLCKQSVSNRQGREGELSEKEGCLVRDQMKTATEQCYDVYEKILEKGLAREIARTVLPVSTYTQFYWKIDLRNLLHFLYLRTDRYAQKEIRDYADIILDIVKIWVPNTYDAFVSYKKDAVSLSKEAWDAVKRMLNGEDVTYETSGLVVREWEELQAFLQR